VPGTGTGTPVSFKRGRGRPPGSCNRNRSGHSHSLSPAIIINDQRVTWAFIKLVYKRLHCDWDDTADAFWKARRATGSNGIYRYIMSGFKPSPQGAPWICRPSVDRENGRMESIRQWWIGLYTPSNKTAARTISSKYPEVKMMLENLIGGMSL